MPPIIKPGFTVHDAYVATCGAFWSKTKLTRAGIPKVSLLPPTRRPTLAQFKYWGEKLSPGASRRLLGVDRSRTTTPWKSGSVQSQVCAVGQLAMMDSTSTDIYLTSTESRLKKLPPMHRTIVKEVRSTVILGFYCGWENPSYWTALQAVLSSADDKVELFRRFGIDVTADDLPAMLCRKFLVDNGEMKCEAATEAEKQFRFTLDYARSHSGQSKSSAESQHHTDHKKLDHKGPGTTHGKRRERGAPHPAELALWNYFEYMYEFLRWVLEYNNQEVPDLAPAEMRRSGIRPTRLNIFKWLRDHGQRADVPCDVRQLRAFALPEFPAVVRTNGIHLLVPDINDRRLVTGHRFFAPALRQEPCWRQASKDDSSVSVIVKVDAQDLSRVWIATPKGLLELPNVLADATTRRQGTLTDWLSHMAYEDRQRDATQGSRDQAAFDTNTRRAGVTANAKDSRTNKKRRVRR